MADKRMFTIKLIDSDAFLDMPPTAQALYFHLGMRADDDGFVSNPKRIMRNAGCSEEDLQALVAKNFIILFESGIVAIKHWRLHNYIQKDRYKPSLCEEKNLVKADDNKVYEVLDTDCIQTVHKMDTDCIQTVHKMDTQIRLDKNRLDKSSREENEPTTTINEEILTMYQDNIHPITPLEAERLTDDIEQYGAEWVKEAIKRAVMRNKRTLGYIEGILRDWATNGYDDGEKKKAEPEDNRPEIPYVSDLMAQFEEMYKC